jgi:photosystem II oxygen-evolving enhancer protein 1
MRYRALIVTLLALCLSVLTACSEAPATSTKVLTYDQIRGTGLANNCPQLEETSRGSIPIDTSKSYKLTGLCLQPTSFFVKEEAVNKRQAASFIPAKLMTRSTSSLDAIQGTLKPNTDGSLTFTEEDGIDFQPVTVQLPGGEQFPFLFTVKNLVATTQPGLSSINTSTDFEGQFKVPSYRTSNFLDPKGRGLTAGYDNAVALPSRADDEELLRENVKQFQLGKGQISLQVAKIDSLTGEIAGTFESEQPSETDMGSREPSEVRVRGVFYARIEPA